MQSEKGSATVPVALFGVSPSRWYGGCHSPFAVPGRVRPARRRDADESGRDDGAPQLQLHRSVSGHEHKSSDVCCAQFGLGRGARREDAADDLLLNEVIWRLIRAAHSPMPAPVHAAFVFAHETDDDD